MEDNKILSNNSSAVETKCSFNKRFDARVVVTTPLGGKENMFCPLKNNPKYVFIVHHAESTHNATADCNNVNGDIVYWNNSYVAGELAYLRSKHLNNLFTPSQMSISPYPKIVSRNGSSSLAAGTTLLNTTLRSRATPQSHSNMSTSVNINSAYRNPVFCSDGNVPVVIVQGEISARRRDLSELQTILETGGLDIYVKVLTRSRPRLSWVKRETWRGQWIQHANMTNYHKAFQGAAFLLAGMNPNVERQKYYFMGHPSSNIAYALHFGLQIIGHEAIPKEYLALNTPFSGGEPAGFWHNGSKSSIVNATVEAICAWRRRCLE
jgi:hypothetical protein